RAGAAGLALLRLARDAPQRPFAPGGGLQGDGEAGAGLPRYAAPEAGAQEARRAALPLPARRQRDRDRGEGGRAGPEDPDSRRPAGGLLAQPRALALPDRDALAARSGERGISAPGPHAGGVDPGGPGAHSF